MWNSFLLSQSSVIILISTMLAATAPNCNGKQNNTTSSQAPASALFQKYNLDKIKLPPGFSISVFAEVPNARSLTLGDKGTLFIGNRSGDKVFAVTDKDKNGVGDIVYTIASGLNTPCGVAFKDGSLYVAEINRILRFDDIENKLENPPAYTVVYDQLPTDRHHGWKFISFGPDGKLYIPVGAPCNICEKENKVYSTICRMNPDGSEFEIFSQGIRNTVGFDWHPQTNELWFTDNGGDNLGDDVPADELNVAPRKDLHFGFPYCHQGDFPDPKFGAGKSCADFVAPAQKLAPHTAALGMRFYTGDLFLPEYKNQIFIAEHGSWNRSTPIGYRVMLVRLEQGKPVQYLPFAHGWLQPNGQVLGRPVDVEVAPDGALLVSDDDRGAVYRIAFSR